MQDLTPDQTQMVEELSQLLPKVVHDFRPENIDENRRVITQAKGGEPGQWVLSGKYEGLRQDDGMLFSWNDPLRWSFYYVLKVDNGNGYFSALVAPVLEFAAADVVDSEIAVNAFIKAAQRSAG